MKKIYSDELNLLVHTKSFNQPETKWIDKAIELLIQQRVNHCKAKLDVAMSHDEAFFTNHLNSQYITYIDKDRNEYGHFSIPVYNMMIDYLINSELHRGIVQQALRQFTHNIITFNTCKYEVKFLLEDYDKTEEDLANALTEIMLILHA